MSCLSYSSLLSLLRIFFKTGLSSTRRPTTLTTTPPRRPHLPPCLPSHSTHTCPTYRKVLFPLRSLPACPHLGGMAPLFRPQSAIARFVLFSLIARSAAHMHLSRPATPHLATIYLHRHRHSTCRRLRLHFLTLQRLQCLLITSIHQPPYPQVPSTPETQQCQSLPAHQKSLSLPTQEVPCNTLPLTWQGSPI